ncbi:AAA family ATPase [Streptomyces aurantiacus]|uniref:Putative WD repeat-containing protein n=1 Tax=Streptomyces aurantiacus JA 4570 TaxID=1286094 RepID=S4A6L4_9ACTN|nr:AAA family ATPase [Streptomyces aurantiacus]EPH46430.1 putative WD repeat-containing protein [Streptomyces aurantiacus JA 4570]
MDRRRLKLCVDVLLVLVAALMGLAANYATSRTDHVPWVLRVLRDWSLPLLGLAVLLLVAGQVWLHLLDRPAPARPAWDSSQPPYPGLEAFTEDDAGVFFGRDREIAELVARLHPVSAVAAARRCVAVIGPSGSGKSSLVRAGLLPALAARRERWAVVPPFAPGTDPVAGLASGLAAVRPLRESHTVRGGRTAPVLLVVDQLEELLTLAGEHEREAFLERVAEALEADPHLWVVVTLRSDFLTEFLETGHAALAQQPVLIGALGRTELFEVIEKPGERAGLAFPPALVARMVDDTGGGDALPLLAYTLQALFLRARDRGAVTEDDYGQLGGVAGALSDQADRIHAELRAADAGAPVLPTLLKFVSLEHGEPTRRRVARADLAPGERAVAEAFVAGRLLTGDGDVLDVAHEALFRRWAPLREAVAAGEETLRRRTELERAARDWANAGWRDAYLFSGERLAVARRWVDEAPDAFAGVQLVVDFLDISVQHDSAALERMADAVARRAIEVAPRDPELAVLAALAAVEECAPTSVAQQALHAALNVAHRRAVFRGHEQDVNCVAWSPDGTRLATASDDGTVRVWDPEGRAEPVVLTRAGGGERVQAVAWAPDGERIAAGSRDRTITVWDVGTRAELGVCVGHDAPVASVSWARDGVRLVSAATDHVARLWDTGTYAGTAVPVERGRLGWNVAWSPDGRQIAASSAEGAVVLWRPRDQAVRHLADGGGAVMALAWSPGGDRLASVSEDRKTRVWDVRRWSRVGILEPAHCFTTLEPLSCVTWSTDGDRIAVGDDRTLRVWTLETREELALVGHADSVNSVSWQGDRIASVSRDRTLALWDLHAPGGQLQTLRGHEGSVVSVDWSPSGTHLVTGGVDGTVNVWDVAEGRVSATTHTGQVGGAVFSPDGTRIAVADHSGHAFLWHPPAVTALAFLDGHREAVTSLAWSPDGTRLATTSRDGTSRVWDASDGRELMTLITGRYWLGGAAWSPDSRYLATSLTDKAFRVWDVEQGTAVATLEGHTDYVWRMAWSPDGRRVATGSRDRTVRLWDPFDGTELRTMTGHTDRVQGIGWSPDGTRLATASWDRTVRLWDPAEGRELAVVGVHDDQVNDLVWSPDGSRLATVSRDRTLRIWNPTTDLNPLLERARSRVFRDLTDEERRSLLLPARRRT